MMVRNLTGVIGEFETEDASDAVAVAICHAVQGGSSAKKASLKNLTLRAAVR